jgi:truncated hemoglobin YjbI
LLLPFLAAGCLEGQKPNPLPRTPSVYTRMGGTAKLETVVDSFVDLAAASTDLPEPIRDHFRGPDTAKLKKGLVRQLGAALGGPYHGTLEELKRALGSPDQEVTSKDAAVLLRLLDRAMESSEVPGDVRQQVLAALQPLRQEQQDKEPAD